MLLADAPQMPLLISGRRVDLEGAIDRCGGDFRADRVAPGHLEALEVLAPAFGARAVAGGERGRFVEEEQLGVVSQRHDLAPAVP